MTNRLTFFAIATGFLIFTAIVIAIAVLLPQNAALYALFAGILGNFSGSFFTLLHVSPPTVTTKVDGDPKTETRVEQK